MATEVLMPKLGLTMTEGTITDWARKEGDSIRKGDPLFSVQTDKLVCEVAAEADGVLLKILLPEGASAPCKSVVAYLGQPGERCPGDAAPCPTTADGAAHSPHSPRHVLIVGGGPGGYVAAIRASQLGARVTLVEQDRLGGTCLNIGCIPTKSLLHTASLLEEIRSRGAQIGLDVSHAGVDFPQVIRHKDQVSRRLSGGVAGLLRRHDVKIVSGTARFTAPKVITVTHPDGTEQIMDADAIILATGSVNAPPPIPGADAPQCVDSTGALCLKALPRRMLVVGGGVIGMELACAYNAFGTKVTVVEAAGQVLPMLDEDIAAAGVEYMRQAGIEVHLQCAVQSIESAGETARITCLASDGSVRRFEAESVLLATGRRPNTRTLHPEVCGIRTDRGAIVVNEQMETSVPGVDAIGACVAGRAQLAHTASAMGEVAAQNCMGQHTSYDEKTSPNCVYILPEAAGVGLTEAQCRARGLAYTVGKFPLSANGKALILNGGNGLVKLIADPKYGELLGLHIIGPHATDLICAGALALGLEATTEELISTIHPHPTVSEALREAALAACGRPIHIPG